MTRVLRDSHTLTGRRPWGAVTTRALALALVVLMAAPLARPVSAVTAEDATVGEIAGNLTQFYGTTVRVTGDVGEALGPRAFTLEDDDLLADQEILIVAGRPMTDRQQQAVGPSTLVSENVRVVGTVWEFNLDDVEQQLGVDLDNDRLADWVGRPAIIARSIVPSPATVVPPAVTVDDVTDDPAAFYGRTSTVVGEIDDILGPRSFTIDDDDLLADEELLVISALPMPKVDDRSANGRLVEDANVRVTGLIRQFQPAEIEAEIGFDLDDAAHSAWIGRPVVVVRSIQAPAAPRG